MNQIEVIDLTLGTGKSAERGSLITAHYTGYLADGTIFDSSHHRGQPSKPLLAQGVLLKAGTWVF